MCFSGIKRGNLWIPTDPPPPNGIFIVDIHASCHWTGADATWKYSYRIFGGNTLVNCADFLAVSAFKNTHIGVCQLWHPNVQINPVIETYYDGWCMVVPQTEGGSWSIPELLSLLSEDPLWAQWLNPRPTVNDFTFYNLYDGPNRVNVKIKIDHS